MNYSGTELAVFSLSLASMYINY